MSAKKPRAKRPQIHLSKSTHAVLNTHATRLLLAGGVGGVVEDGEPFPVTVMVERRGTKLYLVPIKLVGSRVLPVKKLGVNNAYVCLNSLVKSEGIREGHYHVKWDEGKQRLVIDLGKVE